MYIIPVSLLERRGESMRRKLFLMAVLICSGVVSAYLMTGAAALFPVAAGLLAVAFLVRFAGIPRYSCGCFILGVFIFLWSFWSYETGGLTPFEGVKTEISARVKSVEFKEEDNFKITVSDVKVDGERAAGDILVSYYSNLSEDLKTDSIYDIIGRRIEFTGELTKPAESGNPRVFDYRLYLRGNGIGWITTAKNIEVKGYDGAFTEIYGKTKSEIMKLRESFLKEADPDSVSLLAGVLFGDTDSLDEDEYEAFRANGTAHVLAVSGLHVGMIYALFEYIRKKIYSRWIQAFFMTFLILYGFITLWSVSVTRAIILIFIRMGGELSGRRFDMLTALAFTALIIVLREPYAIFGAGFQMSFLAVISIVFIVPKVEERWGKGLSIILGVQIPLMPYIAYTFNYFSPAGIIANIPVVFLISLFVPIGIGCFMFFSAGQLLMAGNGFLPEAARVVLNGLSGATVWVNDLFYMDGKLVIDVVSPGLWVIVLIFCGTYFLVSEFAYTLRGRSEITKRAACIAMIFLAAFTTWICSKSDFDRAEAVMTDVGQGDCLHIRWEDMNILIDGGGSSSYNVGEKTLKPYLLRNGFSHVDLALATHLHMDHYKGLTELAAAFDVREEITRAKAGQVINGPGGRKIEIIFPVDYPKPAEDGEISPDENLNSLIFKVHCDGFTILVTGDITEEGERLLLSEYEGTDVLKADVLKVAHHGSRDSTCDEFLEEVDPDIAIIGVGKNNYGHPADEVIEKLEENDIIVYRTDVHGAIGMREEDGRIKVCTQKRKNTPLRFFPAI